MRTEHNLSFWWDCLGRLPSVPANIRFASEEQCRARLTEVRWPDGFVCPRCQGRETWRLARGALLQCRTCKAQISITVGTVMGGCRQSVQTWLIGAEYLVGCCSTGIVPTIKEVGDHLGLKYTAARRLRQGLLKDLQDQNSVLLRCLCVS